MRWLYFCFTLPLRLSLSTWLDGSRYLLLPTILMPGESGFLTSGSFFLPLLCFVLSFSRISSTVSAGYSDSSQTGPAFTEFCVFLALTAKGNAKLSGSVYRAPFCLPGYPFSVVWKSLPLRVSTSSLPLSFSTSMPVSFTFPVFFAATGEAYGDAILVE